MHQLNVNVHTAQTHLKAVFLFMVDVVYRYYIGIAAVSQPLIICYVLVENGHIVASAGLT